MTNKDTFCEYVRLYETSMYSLAFSIVGNDCDAADVISESVYRAYRSLDTGGHDYESLLRQFKLCVF